MIIAVKHNFETAHRLFQTPGKCQQIHGHSWWCTLQIKGQVQRNGMVLEYGEVKRSFRAMLDTHFDHRLLLNQDDTLALLQLPGCQLLKVDPTTENVARGILDWAASFYGQDFEYRVELWETSVNCAVVGDF